MSKEGNVDAAGCGGSSLPEGGTEHEVAAQDQTQRRLAHVKWLELFFKTFRDQNNATALGSDCCALVKMLGLDAQNFTNMSELLAEADEEDEDWNDMYKTAVDTEIDTVHAELAAGLTKDGGSPATVTFDIGVLKEIRQKMIAYLEDESKDEDSKKRWKEYEQWCNGLLDVRTKEKEVEMVKAVKGSIA